MVQERITAFKGIFPLWQESQQLSFILSTVGSIFSLHSAPIFLPNISSDFFNDAGGLMIVIQKVRNSLAQGVITNFNIDKEVFGVFVGCRQYSKGNLYI